MKKSFVIIALAILAIMLVAGTAVAATPTTYSNDTGASLWSYQDSQDAAAKLEGSYRLFQNDADDLYDFDAAGRDSGPHGGYNTTSNKCKTCHAVHRASGTFALLRVDSPDQACEYCHIGDSRHSVVNAYWQEGDIYPSNGHTIGYGSLTGSAIPDSSVYQTEVVNAAGGTIRNYDSNRNKLMRWTMHGGRWIRVGPTYLRCQSCHQPHNAFRQVWKPAKSADGGATSWTGGYKLLRNAPSGGIASGYQGKNVAGTIVYSGAYRLNPDLGFFDSLNSTMDPRLKAIERATIDTRADLTNTPLDDGLTTAVDFAGGVNRTGYTPFRYVGDGWNTGDAAYAYYANVPVYETSLSFWCADCHNLNIAGKNKIAQGNGVGKFGDSMLGDRSHVVPFMITNRDAANSDAAASAVGATTGSGFHCYTCHNNDMPRTGINNYAYTIAASGDTGAATATLTNKCGPCHIPPRNYRLLKQTYRQFKGENGGPSLSDFPHSGPSAGYKLLNSIDGTATWDAADTANGEADTASIYTAYTGGADALDKICLICHGPQGSRSIGYDK